MSYREAEMLDEWVTEEEEKLERLFHLSLETARNKILSVADKVSI
jgi:hypothetical protein